LQNNYWIIRYSATCSYEKFGGCSRHLGFGWAG